jgi:RNA polymerase sigma-70 factor (ECF subfamily)
VIAAGSAGAPSFAAAIRQLWLAASALSMAGDRRGDDASDAELVERARRDEPRALQAIYQRHAAAVYRRLTHLVGADPEREDLMQEVFADLFRQLGRLRGAALLRTYLFRIVANKAYDHLRERQRRRKRQGNDDAAAATGADGQALEAVALASSPEDRVRVRQELALIGQALERLAPKKRIAYVLRVVDELSLKEIGEQVGATVFTVAQRIRHADREIRRFLEGRLR